MSSDVTYCEMCGRLVKRREAKIVFIEGARLTLCGNCYSKVSKSALASEIKEATAKPSKPLTTSKPTELSKTSETVSKKVPLEEYEVVADYAERVRKAREKLGWTQKVLAEVVKESENVIKRIEAGRLTPSVDLALKLERALGIKLLEPIADVETISLNITSKPKKDLTLGDVMVLRKREDRESGEED